MNYLFNDIPVSIPEPHPGDYKKKREHFYRCRSKMVHR